MDKQIQFSFNLTKDLIDKIDNLPSIQLNSRMKDLTGVQSGKLTLLKPAEKHPRGTLWWAICSCPEHNIIKIPVGAVGRKKILWL